MILIIIICGISYGIIGISGLAYWWKRSFGKIEIIDYLICGLGFVLGPWAWLAGWLSYKDWMKEKKWMDETLAMTKRIIEKQENMLKELDDINNRIPPR